jgi:hypothetical protein
MNILRRRDFSCIWHANHITPTSPLQRLPTRSPDSGLQPLNFRVSAEFRREFKTYAAAHDLKLNELLRLAFEAYRRIK